MRLRVLIFTAVISLILAAPASAQRNLKPRYNDPIENYTEVEAEGWTLLVNKRLDEHPELRQEAIETMQWQLWIIQRIVPEHAVKVMKGVKIWLEYKCVGSAQYHPDRDWLEKNDYNPAKARCVDVGDVTQHTRRMPGRAVMVLLHELVHAWHHQTIGFDDERIIEAYKKSRDSGVYDEVMRDRHVKVRHYALTNHKEWFAEISETYLWVNDYYPFNRAELKVVDPQAYELMREIWGKPTPTQAEIEAEEKSYTDDAKAANTP